MGLQGRTASGYTGEALPAQANWAGKSRCWLVCHALCSHPADLSFVAAAMHLACAPTAIPSPFHAVPCFGGESSRNAYTTSHVREPVPPVCTVLYSHSCSAALLLPCLSSTATAAAGIRLSVCRTDRCKVGFHCRSTSRPQVPDRRSPFGLEGLCAGAKPAGSVERSSEPCLLASLPCKTSLNCSSGLWNCCFRLRVFG